MRQTFREFELEQEVQKLKFLVAELQCRYGMLVETGVKYGDNLASIQELELPYVKLYKAATTKVEFDILSRGLRIVYKAMGDKGEDDLGYSEYLELPVRKSDVPYLLDRMYENFQRTLHNFLTKRNKI